MQTNRRKYPKANLGAAKRRNAARRNAEVSKASKRRLWIYAGLGTLAVATVAVVVMRRNAAKLPPNYADLPGPPAGAPRPTPFPMEPIPYVPVEPFPQQPQAFDPSVESTSSPTATIGPPGGIPATSSPQSNPQFGPGDVAFFPPGVWQEILSASPWHTRDGHAIIPSPLPTGSRRPGGRDPSIQITGWHSVIAINGAQWKASCGSGEQQIFGPVLGKDFYADYLGPLRLCRPQPEGGLGFSGS